MEDFVSVTAMLEPWFDTPRPGLPWSLKCALAMRCRPQQRPALRRLLGIGGGRLIAALQGLLAEWDALSPADRRKHAVLIDFEHDPNTEALRKKVRDLQGKISARIDTLKRQIDGRGFDESQKPADDLDYDVRDSKLFSSERSLDELKSLERNFLDAEPADLPSVVENVEQQFYRLRKGGATAGQAQQSEKATAGTTEATLAESPIPPAATEGVASTCSESPTPPLVADVDNGDAQKTTVAPLFTSSTTPPRKSGRGRPPRYDWEKSVRAVNAKLIADGVPTPGDGGQTALEALARSKFHADRCPTGSRFREKVVELIQAHKEALGVTVLAAQHRPLE
jgi:hypothetical protein